MGGTSCWRNTENGGHCKRRLVRKQNEDGSVNLLAYRDGASKTKLRKKKKRLTHHSHLVLLLLYVNGYHLLHSQYQHFLVANKTYEQLLCGCTFSASIFAMWHFKHNLSNSSFISSSMNKTVLFGVVTSELLEYCPCIQSRKWINSSGDNYVTKKKPLFEAWSE